MKGSRFGALLGSTLVLTLAVAGPAAAGPLPLYYSFGFDTDMAPPYSIHLGAGNWHVGSAGGPLAMTSPECIGGNQRSFWSSDPNFQTGNIAREPWTETALRTPASPASSSMHVRP